MTFTRPLPAAAMGPAPPGVGRRSAADREVPPLLLDRVLAGRLVSGTVLLGLLGSLLVACTAAGAGGILVFDPLLSGSPLSWLRYGHGRELATALLYVGAGLLIWAWVRLGRDVLANRARAAHVLVAGAVWIAPMLLAPPLFTRDVYSYLAQGALALHGFDPYLVGPVVLPAGPVVDNVHYVWQTTPAPYGPFFILIAKIMSWLIADNVIAGVIGMRLLLLSGLILLILVLPRLADELGGKRTMALWLVVTNPMTVVHLVGGPHNDLLMVGLLAAGILLVLQRRHLAGIALVTVAMAIKASAAVVLPFLVWIWAARLRAPGQSRTRGLLVAGSASVAMFASVFVVLSLLAGVGLGWIPALNAPSLIINWMSLPTAAGQFVHLLSSPFHDIGTQPFIDVFRIIGSGVFLAIFAWQWWLGRDGGPDTVRRAAIVLLFSAVLAPAVLPWYFTWALVVAAALAWRPRPLALVVAASTWLVVCTYPTGESGLESWPYQFAVIAVAVLAAASLLRHDPLRLRAASSSRPRPLAPESLAPSEPRTAHQPLPGPEPLPAPEQPAARPA